MFSLLLGTHHPEILAFLLLISFQSIQKRAFLRRLLKVTMASRVPNRFGEMPAWKYCWERRAADPGPFIKFNQHPSPAAPNSCWFASIRGQKDFALGWGL